MSLLTVNAYQPTPALDGELAALGYAVTLGWADQRPITPSLVRSRLRPMDGAPPTLLACARDERGGLQGFAALRHPAPGGTGRLWGPVVADAVRRQGLGRPLLAGLSARVPSAVPVRTAEIPGRRVASHRFYESAGWTPAPSSVLLKRSLPMPLATTGHGPAIRPLGVDGEAGAGIARLFAATCPELGPAMAADPLERWRADERFRPDTLQLAHDGGRVVGAALVLVLAHTDLEEPTEALLGDLLVDPEAPVPDRLRRQLLAQALEAGAKAGATVARAIVQERDALTRELLADQLGFEVVDTIHFYETTLTA